MRVRRASGSGIVAAVSLAAIVALPTVAETSSAAVMVDEDPGLCIAEEPLGQAASGPLTDEVASSNVIGSGAVPGVLGGRWRELPKSPFSSSFGSAVWAGDEMIVVAGETTDIAGYDPRTRTWTRYPKPPDPFVIMAPLTWTGTEVITRVRHEEAESVEHRTMALDLATGSWRDVPSPLGGYGAAVWTGSLMVTSDGDAYDPVEDCWYDLPEPPPGQSYFAGLHWTGDEVLLVTTDADAEHEVSVARLDLDTATWGEAAQSPVRFRGSGGVWVGSELVFLPEGRNKADDIIHGAYDPATDTWRTLDVDCHVEGVDQVWTGELIIDASRWAVEPTSGACVKLPARHDRTRTYETRLWTGREVIEWSGQRGDDMTTFPDGLWYRPKQ